MRSTVKSVTVPSPIASVSHSVVRSAGRSISCGRVALRYADGDSGPASVVLKVAAADPSSRQTGLAMGLYEREVR
ncbi:phosphotransferase, partial [Mycobacterium sp. ITM-2017-0098]